MIQVPPKKYRFSKLTIPQFGYSPKQSFKLTQDKGLQIQNHRPLAGYRLSQCPCESSPMVLLTILSPPALSDLNHAPKDCQTHVPNQPICVIWASEQLQAMRGKRGGGQALDRGGGGIHNVLQPPLPLPQLFSNKHNCKNYFPFSSFTLSSDTHPGQQGGPTEARGRSKYDRVQAHSLLLKTQ